MNEREVRAQLATGWEYTYAHDAWTVPLEEALHGLNAEDALKRVGETCIWQIVLHMAVWNENIVERVRTGEAAHPEEGAWPELPTTRVEASWEASKKRLRKSVQAVQAMLETEPFERLMGPPYGLADILCRYTHMGYHFGQIVKMRESL